MLKLDQQYAFLNWKTEVNILSYFPPLSWLLGSSGLFVAEFLLFSQSQAVAIFYPNFILLCMYFEKQ